MNIHLLSDLHLDAHGMPPVPALGDVLVLAGDIDEGRRPWEGIIKVASNYLAARKAVLLVPGNHEYHGHRAPRLLWQLHQHCRRAGIQVLSNRGVVHQGVHFVGATLWTDFNLDGAPEQARRIAKQTMFDYSGIFDGKGKLIRPETTARWHAKSRRRLADLMGKYPDLPVVLAVHHGLHPQSILPKWQGHSANPAMVSDLTDLILKYEPRYCFHGHLHNSVNYSVGRSRIVANPRGKVKTVRLPDGFVLATPENKGFNPGLLLPL